MADPYYGAAPRQESTVIRTNAEYDAMREARAAKIRAEALAAKKKAQEASGYNEFANRFKGAPSVADIMALTGASGSDAAKIRGTQEWTAYAPQEEWDKMNLANSQAMLADDKRVAPEFQWKFLEPETAGKVVPFYKDLGNGAYQQPSWQVTSGSGEEQGPIPAGLSKDEFYRAAMGAGVGTAGLDQWARDVTGIDTMSWASMTPAVWDSSVKQYQNAWSDKAGGLRGGSYQGYGGTYRGDPTLWGGDTYAVRGSMWDFPSLVNDDGTSQSMQDMPGTGYGLYTPQKNWFGAINQYRQDLKPISAMNADFGNAMAQRDQNRIRSEQGYDQLTGFGFNGGLLNDSYSDPFFGQITGREATQSPFAMSEQGPYPWSTPTQQLDLASLMSPAYGGPNGMKSMGQYGGTNSWGGQNRTGGLGGLGGFSSGPFGAKNPWSPA